MKKRLIIIITMFFFLFAACDKTETSDLPTVSKYQPYEYVIDMFTGTWYDYDNLALLEISYDNDGNLSGFLSKNNLNGQWGITGYDTITKLQLGIINNSFLQIHQKSINNYGYKIRFLPIVPLWRSDNDVETDYDIELSMHFSENPTLDTGCDTLWSDMPNAAIFTKQYAK